MNWRNVKLVWRREIRDQLRDRRTLFVIAVLPLLIYPMMGILLFRLTPFIEPDAARVTVIGAEQLTEAKNLPPLLTEGSFSRTLFQDPIMAEQLQVERLEGDDAVVSEARNRLAKGDVDVVVYFPPGFAERQEAVRRAVEEPDRTTEGSLDRRPRPVVYFNSARDASQIAQSRVQVLLDRWQAAIVRGNLAAGRMPVDVTQPFQIEPQDVSSDERRQAAFWSKLLPFIVFICALTGAFYPAVDLCAGEKERGTLETLLTSPAQRSEIVGGKLLTVITFSIGSALCNLLSMGITGQIMMQQINAYSAATGGPPLAPPSLAALVWLLLALVPMAALFSAASLALASLARSTKEGQYYLMPLFLVCMPLMLLPLSPGVELSLGSSLLPITGMVLLMRAAMEGDLALAATYAVPVAVVTLACCALAVRWAVDQFNQESVLFRDTENFSLASWARHGYHHRPQVPSLFAAALLIVLIYLLQFGSQGFGWGLADIVKLILVSQLGCILLPLVVLSLVSVRSVRQTLLLAGPVPWGGVVIGVLLAVALLPVGTALMEVIHHWLPISPALIERLEQLGQAAGGPELSLGAALLLVAVLPAICEELAFRGFILSGFRQRLSVGWAIVLSALFFGLAHSTAVQQTISAAILGLVFGYLAIKTGHISTCIAMHMSYNGLQLLRVQFADQLARAPLAGWILRPSDTPAVVLGFTAPVVVAGGVLALWLLWQVGRNSRREAGAASLPEGRYRSLPSAAPAEESGT